MTSLKQQVYSHVVRSMDSREIFPAENIAFYNDEERFRQETPDWEKSDNIDIFEFGPWQNPTEDTSICARYVIGHSKKGYHWDTEFVISDIQSASEINVESIGIKQDPELLSWSPACAFVDQAIKHARRCIAIQAKNIHLDTKTKIKMTLQEGHVTYFDIDKVPLHKSLVYSVTKSDLQRLALFNGYLSWSEFENGTLDFSSK